MRKITLNDSFLFSKILNKTKLTADINQMVNEGKSKGAEYVGGQLFLLILEKWHLADKEIVEFLSSLAEKTPEQIRDLDIAETAELFEELAKDEGMKKLFTRLVGQSK